MLQHIPLLWRVQFQNKFSSQSFVDYISFLKGKMQAGDDFLIYVRVCVWVCACVCVCALFKLMNLVTNLHEIWYKQASGLLISNFCHVLNVVGFLPGNSLASEFCTLTFWNNLSVPSSKAGRYEVYLHTYLPMKMEQTDCSKMSAYKIQMLRNYPEESIQQASGCHPNAI